MENVEELTAALQPKPHPCQRTVHVHQCDLVGCPSDDPEWMHHCYANDCDFTEAEAVQVERGLLTQEELLVRGGHRAYLRRMRERVMFGERRFL